MIYVCSLPRVRETYERIGARRMITLINEGTPVDLPETLDATEYLRLDMHDIAEVQEGMMPPGEAHVRRLLAFAEAWDQSQPLLVHCFAGISRSTATAYTIAAALNPGRDEAELAWTLRKLSPSATPNPRIVAFADDILGRSGRMVRAIRDIGRGEDAYEGTPFGLGLEG
ncbi:protein tyrosine phosphatase [Escherichia coli]|nr:protein tyrosine phosphatase [Escherichia coli]